MLWVNTCLNVCLNMSIQKLCSSGKQGCHPVSIALSLPWCPSRLGTCLGPLRNTMPHLWGAEYGSYYSLAVYFSFDLEGLLTLGCRLRQEKGIPPPIRALLLVQHVPKDCSASWLFPQVTTDIQQAWVLAVILIRQSKSNPNTILKSRIDHNNDGEKATSTQMDIMI